MALKARTLPLPRNMVKGGFSVGANAFTGVSYSGEPSATSTSGAIFGTINLQNATGSYAYYVVGFGYHSLLVTSEWNNGSSFEKFQGGNYGAVSSHSLYVLNLTYATNTSTGDPLLAGVDKAALSAFPLTFSNNVADVTNAPCYAEGTKVLTARGEVAVENLVEGDEAGAGVWRHASGDLDRLAARAAWEPSQPCGNQSGYG